VSIDEGAGVRFVPEPEGIRAARTLPAAWYSDPSFYVRETQAVFRRSWVCAGMVDEMPAAGGWSAVDIAGLPVLLIRDRDGQLRAFLNVCRHRAAPLCEVGEAGSGTLLRCPYHSWLYRLDGSLARASGVGEPDGFDRDNYSLKPVSIATWRRWVFVNADADAADFDPGRLGAAIDAFPLEDLVEVLSESHERPFNWKVLLENYSENYHTPFVHPEIDTTATQDYPMIADGIVLYAWDRTLNTAAGSVDRLRADLLPGEPGWELQVQASSERPYDIGSYLTVWPNLMINVFPDALLTMWMQPTSANTVTVHRRLHVSAQLAADTAVCDSIVEAHRLVHQQDVDICAMVQRSHNAGIDADGVLATVEERGVYFVHQHVRAAMAAHSPQA
jgi:glycine betaine catabolism A